MRIIFHAEILAIKYLFWQFKNRVPFFKIYFIKSNMILIKTMGNILKWNALFHFKQIYIQLVIHFNRCWGYKKENSLFT